MTLLLGSNARRHIKAWVPPRAFVIARRLMDYVRPAAWELVPDWATARPLNKGWDVPSIGELERRKWSAFRRLVQDTGPLGINHEAVSNTDGDDLTAHNVNMSFAYVVALAARKKSRLTMLDWGGGVGHYYLLGKAALADVEIDYYCQDMPALCSIGRNLLPEGTFYDVPGQCFHRAYDLVVAGSSLWYEEHWRETLKLLVSATDGFLYVTRMLFVNEASSFVALQRPWAAGYETQYLCWVLNRTEFIRAVEELGAKLVREFYLGEGPHIHRGPEDAAFRGFLFRRMQAGEASDVAG